MDLWFTEKQTNTLGLSLKVLRTLVTEHTQFQDLAVLETEQYGRMLVLDGIIQTTTADEFVYHEMITHVALFTHKDPKTVAIIGGGDGGAVREVVKHPGVERVVLVEIDERVVAASRQYLPEIAAGLSDERVEVRFEDGIRHIRENKGVYDVVIVDSTDPIGAAVGLFSAEFYADIYESLKDDGIMVAQTESPFHNQDLIRKSFSAIRDLFPITRLYLAYVPTYPSGMWSFTIASKENDPLSVPMDRFINIPTKYYTPQIHFAAFTLPQFVGQMLQG
ncbi:MAG: polyamine aminopropyltransferase [Limnochordia bacterium]|jgi:spermidine synthase